MPFRWIVLLAASSLFVTACNGGRDADVSADLPESAQCVLRSPTLDVGTRTDLTIDGVTYTNSHLPDAPGTVETPLDNVGPLPQDCSSDGFRFGSGIYDTTGPIGGQPTGHADLAGMVLPPQPQNGIHTRLYSRAFVVESPCNGKRVVYVSDDHTFSTALVRQEVLKRLAADPELAEHYTGDNVMLSATHTHAAGGGYGDPKVLPNAPAPVPQTGDDVYNYVQSLVFSTSPFDADNTEAIVDGITRSIKRAHQNLEAHPQTGRINLSIGELLNANRSRDMPAYVQNSPAERAQYINDAGNEIDVTKRFLQLSFVRDNGSPVGVINWFGVHPTAMGNHSRMISSDTKGDASLGFERLMGTRYVADDSAMAEPGADNFVAAFAQTDEGNAVPDLFIFDADTDGNDGPGQGVPYRLRLGTDEDYDFSDEYYARGLPKASRIFGMKQLAQAIRQFGEGTALRGPVDYRLFHVDMSAIEVTDDDVIRDSTFADLPAALYPEQRATCTGAVGAGKFVGGANGPVFGAAGFTCQDTAPVDIEDDIRNHYNGLFNGTNSIYVQVEGNYLEVPVNGVALYTAMTPVLCTTTALQPQFDCQAEKVVFTEFGGEPAPFQLFRIGNLAILGLPWEVTTMAGRRLRRTLLEALSPVGVDTVVISGLTNAYLDYMTTREEYSAQMYEGASTDFGPWQLAAAQQQVKKLAMTMVSGDAAPEGVELAAIELGDASPVTIDLEADFGTIITDAADSYVRGDSVEVSFVGGYPGNDLKRMSSYVYVEHQTASGDWEVIATDKDPELLFIWNGTTNVVSTLLHTAMDSENIAVWSIPLDAPAGNYRIRHDGVFRLAQADDPTPYTGVTKTFTISGAPADCPD